MPLDIAKPIGGRARGDEGCGENRRACHIANTRAKQPVLRQHLVNSDSASANQLKSFEHEPLDLETGSIRLTEVLPPGSDGTICCGITHDDFQIRVGSRE
jgi:hypothetical protein